MPPSTKTLLMRSVPCRHPPAGSARHRRLHARRQRREVQPVAAVDRQFLYLRLADPADRVDLVVSTSGASPTTRHRFLQAGDRELGVDALTLADGEPSALEHNGGEPGELESNLIDTRFETRQEVGAACLLWSERWVLVPTCVAVTVTPGSTPPESSVIMPEISARRTCAAARPEVRNRAMTPAMKRDP